MTAAVFNSRHLQRIDQNRKRPLRNVGTGLGRLSELSDSAEGRQKEMDSHRCPWQDNDHELSKEPTAGVTPGGDALPRSVPDLHSS